MKKLLLITIILSMWSCDNSTEPASKDCAGVVDGAAYLDDCGTCDNDSTNDNTTCLQDCAGIWGGDAELNECFLGKWVGDMNNITVAGENFVYEWIQATTFLVEPDTITVNSYNCAEEFPNCDNWWTSGGDIVEERYHWYVADNQIFIDFQTVVASILFNNPDEITTNMIMVTSEGEMVQSGVSHRCTEEIDCIGVCGGTYICD